MTDELPDAQPGARDPDATFEELCRIAYPDLKRLAHARLGRRGGHSILDTTGLVNEAYTKMLSAGRVSFEGRLQFLTYATQVMRSIIVDLAREASALRNGGDLLRVTFAPELIDGAAAGEDPLRVNDALAELARVEPRLALVVEMRFFAGCTEAEIAAALGVNERTVRRDWGRAKVLLHSMLKS